MSITTKERRRGLVAVGAAALALTTFPTACAAPDTAEAGAAGQLEEPPLRSTIPRGTSLSFRVDEEVSTESHRKGHRFTSTLTGDARGVEGESAAPAGSKGIWRVVEARADDGAEGSALVVALEELEVDGVRYPVAASVVSTEMDVEGRDSGTESAVKIGIGAAAGAVVGRLLGDDASDALKGAGVGAAFGTAVALSTRSGAVRLPAGSRVVVRLDQPLTLDGHGH